MDATGANSEHLYRRQKQLASNGEIREHGMILELIKYYEPSVCLVLGLQ